jgi:hypothetical protein
MKCSASIIIWRSKCGQALSTSKLALGERLTGVLDTMLGEDTMTPITNTPDNLNFAGWRSLNRRGRSRNGFLRSMILLPCRPSLGLPWMPPIILDGSEEMFLVASSYCIPMFAIRVIWGFGQILIRFVYDRCTYLRQARWEQH